MRLRSIATLFLALVLGGVAVLLARTWLERTEPTVVAEQQPQMALTKVVVARTALFFGNRINAEQVREVNWPADSVPPGAFTSADELLSGEEPRTVLRAIEANEPILASKISGAGEKATLSAIISEEMRAMTIRVNDVIGVAGFVVPGDRVDILLTREEGEKNEITDILLQNVKVLGIDQLASDNQEKPVVVQAVTVEVSPEQAQKLTLAAQVGSLTLALRNVLDADAEFARTVSKRDLKVGEVNDAVADSGKSEKTKVAKVRAKAVDPLASVKIFRALTGSEYKVEKEGGGAGAPAPRVKEGTADAGKPAAPVPAVPPAPASPTAPTPLLPQPEVSAGTFEKPSAAGAEI
ncbi:MAG TPA: Flp pilus assembly protein CpaB [Alphaproteobacteria bacterium]|nr:Flp pilus assembly protein CpaB [Alphaproteobacteria bacterium]